MRGTTAGRIGTAQIQMVFQSTSPVRGTTQARRPGICGYMNFNPRPPHGGRHMLLLPRVRDRDFNPRPPHGGRRQANSRGRKNSPISIHVPRAGDDKATLRKLPTVTHFNPRPPCGGRLRRKLLPICFEGISIHVPRAGDDGK